MLAAAPATPVQLTHACLAAGFDAAVPASWGDEIIAREAIRTLENANGPLVFCVCPRATRRLGADGALASLAFACPPPPVATAAYVRAMFGPRQVHVTFVGACTAGAHSSIDVWLSPEELLADFQRRGISLGAQPLEFDAVLPPDRRRHYSDPGGLPAGTALARLTPPAPVIELRGEDFAVDLAQHLLGQTSSLIDLSAALGCACAGVTPGTDPRRSRDRVRDLEPPRSPTPVIEEDVPLPEDLVARGGGSRAANVPETPPLRTVPREVEVVASEAARPAVAVLDELPQGEPARPRSTGANRVVVGAMPQLRAAGRPLPRAYVARRRSSPRGLRQSGVSRQLSVLETPWFTSRWLLIAVAVGVVAIGGVAVVLAR